MKVLLLIVMTFHYEAMPVKEVIHFDTMASCRDAKSLLVKEVDQPSFDPRAPRRGLVAVCIKIR